MNGADDEGLGREVGERNGRIVGFSFTSYAVLEGAKHVFSDDGGAMNGLESKLQFAGEGTGRTGHGVGWRIVRPQWLFFGRVTTFPRSLLLQPRVRCAGVGKGLESSPKVVLGECIRDTVGDGSKPRWTERQDSPHQLVSTGVRGCLRACAF